MNMRLPTALPKASSHETKLNCVVRYHPLRKVQKKRGASLLEAPLYV